MRNLNFLPVKYARVMKRKKNESFFSRLKECKGNPTNQSESQVQKKICVGCQWNESEVWISEELGLTNVLISFDGPTLSEKKDVFIKLKDHPKKHKYVLKITFENVEFNKKQ